MTQSEEYVDGMHKALNSMNWARWHILYSQHLTGVSVQSTFGYIGSSRSDWAMLDSVSTKMK